MRILGKCLALLALTLSCAEPDEPSTTSAEEAIVAEPLSEQPRGEQDVPVLGSEPADPKLVNHAAPPPIAVRRDVIDAQNKYLAEAAKLRTRLAAQNISEESIEAQTAELKRSLLGD